MSFDPKPIIDLGKKLEADIVADVVKDAGSALIPALESMANSLLPAGSSYLTIAEMVEKSADPALEAAFQKLLSKLVPAPAAP